MGRGIGGGERRGWHEQRKRGDALTTFLHNLLI